MTALVRQERPELFVFEHLLIEPPRAKKGPAPIPVEVAARRLAIDTALVESVLDATDSTGVVALGSVQRRATGR